MTTETRLRESFARQTMMETFGARLVEVQPGLCRIEAPILDLARQQHGTGHAALSFALGDTAAGYAALTLLPPDREVMTAEIKINLLRPATGALLRAVGRVVKPGRRLIVVTAEVADEGGALVAIMQGTMVPVDPPATF